eukprot:gb/GECG01010347.1/.p1 GENE.gb/GECG01010347.1/~~gb/GECG01010347.1/.p1  ORF type:complete len:976 (+),score=186.10 gb/GECG01010347.1/:1-2928(+)
MPPRRRSRRASKATESLKEEDDDEEAILAAATDDNDVFDAEEEDEDLDPVKGEDNSESEQDAGGQDGDEIGLLYQSSDSSEEDVDEETKAKRVHTDDFEVGDRVYTYYRQKVLYLGKVIQKRMSKKGRPRYLVTYPQWPGEEEWVARHLCLGYSEENKKYVKQLFKEYQEEERERKKEERRKKKSPAAKTPPSTSVATTQQVQAKEKVGAKKDDDKPSKCKNEGETPKVKEKTGTPQPPKASTSGELVVIKGLDLTDPKFESLEHMLNQKPRNEKKGWPGIVVPQEEMPESQQTKYKQQLSDEKNSETQILAVMPLFISKFNPVKEEQFAFVRKEQLSSWRPREERLKSFFDEAQTWLTRKPKQSRVSAEVADAADFADRLNEESDLSKRLSTFWSSDSDTVIDELRDTREMDALKPLSDFEDNTERAKYLSTMLGQANAEIERRSNKTLLWLRNAEQLIKACESIEITVGLLKETELVTGLRKLRANKYTTEAIKQAAASLKKLWKATLQGRKEKPISDKQKPNETSAVAPSTKSNKSGESIHPSDLKKQTKGKAKISESGTTNSGTATAGKDTKTKKKVAGKRSLSASALDPAKAKQELNTSLTDDTRESGSKEDREVLRPQAKGGGPMTLEQMMSSLKGSNSKAPYKDAVNASSTKDIDATRGTSSKKSTKSGAASAKNVTSVSLPKKRSSEADSIGKEVTQKTHKRMKPNGDGNRTMEEQRGDDTATAVTLEMGSTPCAGVTDFYRKHAIGFLHSTLVERLFGLRFEDVLGAFTRGQELSGNGTNGARPFLVAVVARRIEANIFRGFVTSVSVTDDTIRKLLSRCKQTLLKTTDKRANLSDFIEPAGNQYLRIDDSQQLPPGDAERYLERVGNVLRRLRDVNWLNDASPEHRLNLLKKRRDSKHVLKNSSWVEQEQQHGSSLTKGADSDMYPFEREDLRSDSGLVGVELIKTLQDTKALESLVKAASLRVL